MFRGARRALYLKAINLLAFLRSIPGYFGTPPMQELTGTTALFDNVALDLGRDLVINGDFANWTGVFPADAPDDWSVVEAQDATHYWTDAIPGARILTDGTNLMRMPTNVGSVTAGKTYRLTTIVSAVVANGVRVQPTGGVPAYEYTAPDTYVENFTALQDGEIFLRRPLAAATTDATVASITLKQTGILDSGDYPLPEVLANGDFATDTVWIKGAGWTITGGQAIATATTAVIRQNSVLVAGIRYRVEIDVASLSGDSYTVKLGNVNIGEISSTGTTIVEAVSDGTNVFIVGWAGSGLNIAVNSISVTPANPLNGDYVGVSLAQPGAGNITYFVAFGGAADYLTVLSAEHNSALNPLSFEIVIYGNAFTWDANVRTLLNYYVDASNYIRIDKTATAGQLAVYYQEEGVALVTQLIATGSPAGLFSVGIGVESNVFQATYNGAQSGANQATTSAFVGNFTVMTIGALNTTPTNVTLGSLAYPVEFTGLLSAATRLQIKSAFGVA